MTYSSSTSSAPLTSWMTRVFPRCWRSNWTVLIWTLSAPTNSTRWRKDSVTTTSLTWAHSSRSEKRHAHIQEYIERKKLKAPCVASRKYLLFKLKTKYYISSLLFIQCHPKSLLMPLPQIMIPSVLWVKHSHTHTLFCASVSVNHNFNNYTKV